jgi:hypothetical protein
MGSLSAKNASEKFSRLGTFKVTIAEFQYNLFLVSYGDNEIKKRKVMHMAWKSGHTLP